MLVAIVNIESAISNIILPKKIFQAYLTESTICPSFPYMTVVSEAEKHGDYKEEPEN